MIRKPKIAQEFNFNEELFNRTRGVELFLNLFSLGVFYEKSNSPNKLETLSNELKRIQYDVLFSGEIFAGFPERIIVIGKANGVNGLPDIKNDFYKLSEELHLPYSSGRFYMDSSKFDDRVIPL